MLAKEYRLAKKSDFDRVFKGGKKAYGQCYKLYFLANNETANSRFAFVVSNKVSKKATKRNKIRRQSREIIRDNLSKFNTNNDIIIILFDRALDKEYLELKTDLESILRKNRLIV